MPKKLHRKLSRAASKKGLKGKRRAAYIYGTMAKIEKRRKAKRRRRHRKK
jgi:hypothetical protein